VEETDWSTTLISYLPSVALLGTSLSFSEFLST
jgi:hypothetical protein